MTALHPNFFFTSKFFQTTVHVHVISFWHLILTNSIRSTELSLLGLVNMWVETHLQIEQVHFYFEVLHVSTILNNVSEK